MTISSETRKAGPFTGNDVATEFAFAFKVFSSSDLVVVRADALGAETTLVLDTDYTASVNANQNTDPGGSITLSAALATGTSLVITTRIANLQPADITNNGGFFPQVITNALDRLTILVQQAVEQLSRSIKLAISTPDGVNPELPPPAPYSLIGWNAAGDGFQNTDPTYSTALSTDLASTASGKGSSIVGFIQSGTGAVATTVNAKILELQATAKDFGAVCDGVADDYTAAYNKYNASSPRYLIVSGVMKLSQSLVLWNDTVIDAEKQSLTAKSRIYSNLDIPILYRPTGYQSRLIIDNVLFHGQKDGNYSGTTNSNTAPLVYLVEGGAYLELTRSAFMRTTTGIKHDHGYNWQRYRDVKFLGCDTGAHLIGPRHALFNGCTFETCGWGVYAEPSYVEAGVGDSRGASKVMIRDCYTEGADFHLDVAVPEVTGCFFYDTTIRIGKNAVSPVIKNNSILYNSRLVLPPKFSQDVEWYGPNAVNEKTQQPFQIPALPDLSDVSGAGYVAADGLDYFVVTQAKPNTTYSAQAVTVSFNRDAASVSTDAGTLIASNVNADDDGGRTDLALTTYGVIENTGAAMSVTLTGAAADTEIRTAFLQSLIKNGTFTAGSTTNWFATGAPTISHDGTYLRVLSADNANALSYNRLLHLPKNTECVAVLARVKAGSTGAISIYGKACGKFSNFFDNADGTFDDLWVSFRYVKGDKTVGKTAIQCYRMPGETGYDMQVRWIASIPLVGNAKHKVYENTFTFDPSSVAAGATATSTIMSDSSTSNDFKQANVGDYVRIIPPYDLQGMSASGYVSATGQITVRLQNPTAAAIDLASGVWKWELTKQ